jgi:hypothetical protein
VEKEHLEVILENIDKKFDIVIEGYSTLDRKIDDLAKKTEERFDLVDFKIDTLATELKAHREDTEVHHGIYQVKEN